MTLTADLFWSFRSPYSYLAIGRYRALAASHDVTINLRPVYPLAIRQPDFFERNHPNWLSYTVRDMIRVAQFHGIPFGPPRPDPIVQDMTTRAIASGTGMERSNPLEERDTHPRGRASMNFAMQRSPPGSSPSAFGRASRTPKGPLAASRTRSIVKTVAV